MKTLHRLMYENLTPEVYKEFCKCSIYPSALADNWENASAHFAMDDCMLWKKQPQGHDYWQGVYYCIEREWK